jgi:hypothetical protein
MSSCADRIGRKGISPLIASVLSIMLGVMMLAVVLTVIQPTFKNARDSSTIADIFQNLKLLDSAVKEVSSEAEGSRRTIPITVSGGEYRINGTYDWLYATYEPESELILAGRRGDIRVDRGLMSAEYFNWLPDGSTGAPEWTNTSGQWSVSSVKYLGTNGTSYMNITPRPIENFEFSGMITNISGPAGGQIFVLPTGLESLKGFWTFDNRSGDKAYDFSGNSNIGDLTDMDTVGSSTSGWQNLSSCKAGPSCLMFDGTNDYVDVGDSSDLEPSSGFTISLWLKTTQTGSAIILEKDGDSGYSVQRESNNALKMNVGGAGTEIESSSSYNDGNWHHVVFVYRGVNDGSVYVDGVVDTSVSTPGTPSYGANSLVIGSRSGSSGFNGAIDEVMIFDRPFTTDEVASLYELSSKKLYVTGLRSITVKTYATLVLSNPAGQTQFDDVKITRNKHEMSFVIPYNRVDLSGTLRLVKGEHRVEITHLGVNSTLNKPIIGITTS